MDPSALKARFADEACESGKRKTRAGDADLSGCLELKEEPGRQMSFAQQIMSVPYVMFSKGYNHLGPYLMVSVWDH